MTNEEIQQMLHAVVPLLADMHEEREKERAKLAGERASRDALLADMAESLDRIANYLENMLERQDER